MPERQPEVVGGTRANLADHLAQEFGGRWTGVALHYGAVPKAAPVRQEMRLCEAVGRSFVQPIVLLAEKLGCPGARRAFGLLDDDRALAERMAQKSCVPFDTLRQAIAETPCLPAAVTAISLGAHGGAPDVVVGYVHPSEAMSVLRRWQVVYGTAPAVPLSSFLAICARVVVRAHEQNEICISFGCLDSRRFGDIGSDTLVIGMPSARAQQLTSE